MPTILMSSSQGGINGTVSGDATSPLPWLDFEQLWNISESQGNRYIAGAGNKVVNADTGLEGFPSSFWYNETAGVPNIVYVETDLLLNGDIGTIGGFFVVVGDILTDPDETDGIDINGNGQIDGMVYTRGEFRVNGGGGSDVLNVNGGVWAGEEIRLNGNVHMGYNTTFMTALQTLSIDSVPQISSWKEQVTPYALE